MLADVIGLKPRLHQGNMLPGQHVACAGNIMPVSRQHCTPLYPATVGQQTGNNFVAGNMLQGNMLPWCKRGLS